MPDAAEEAGLGAAQEIPPSTRTSDVWAVLEQKVQRPDLFLPVTDVVARPSDDGRGTYREMTLGERRIVENIYCDAAKHEVLFVVVDAATEHVNLITTDAEGVRRLEFFLRDKATLERAPWHVPKAVAMGGIAKVLAAAAARGAVAP